MYEAGNSGCTLDVRASKVGALRQPRGMEEGREVQDGVGDDTCIPVADSC